MNQDRLFVYGTLMPGQENERYLTKIGGTFEPARVRGRLYLPGEWRAGFNYPGLVLDPAAKMVEGYVFRSENLASNWELLDEFEGEEYKRIEAEVETSDGPVKACIYVIDEQCLKQYEGN